MRAAIVTPIRRLLFAPRVKVPPHPPLVRLGTRYGGWEFVDSPELFGCTILSCGLGEDASFDVEFAARYGARVVIVDPTPRAVAHFRAIASRLGQPSTCAYSTDGRLDPASYDLSRIAPQQLTLIDKAIAPVAGTVRFYAPPNPDHVSYSVLNFQNDYSQDTPYIEGAEIEAIEDMLALGLRPRQILVEFDELSRPSRRSRERFRRAHSRLLSAGYTVALHDRRSNFLYVR